MATPPSADPQPSTPTPPDLLAAGVELLVFAPLGFALKARTLVPELVQAGRQEWQRRSTVARFVGKMVVDGSRRNLQQRRSATAASGTATSHASSGSPASSPQPSPAPATTAAAPKAASARTAPRQATGARTPAGATKASAPRATAAARRPRSVPSSGALPISGYDTLATQSIVELLNGLGPADLLAVERYEAAHRGRRTILARVAQLSAAT